MIDDEIKNLIIFDYNHNQLSISEISKKYNIKSKSYISQYILSGKTRTQSEALKLAHKKYEESFRRSEKTKQIMKEKRLLWMKNHPESTAWRLKNMSYPEKCFQEILINNDFDKKYYICREYSVFPYFIDFAFLDEKVAVEIDGSQHLEKDRKERDNKKDALLIQKGWRVLRITATDVMNNNNIVSKLNDFLENSNKTHEIVGIFQQKKEKVIKDKDGLTEKQRLSNFNNRKVKNRPSRDELLNLIKTQTFKKIGETYGVSDKAVVKWCKWEKLPYRKKDIKLL